MAPGTSVRAGPGWRASRPASREPECQRDRRSPPGLLDLPGAQVDERQFRVRPHAKAPSFPRDRRRRARRGDLLLQLLHPLAAGRVRPLQVGDLDRLGVERGVHDKQADQATAEQPEQQQDERRAPGPDRPADDAAPGDAAPGRPAGPAGTGRAHRAGRPHRALGPLPWRARPRPTTWPGRAPAIGLLARRIGPNGPSRSQDIAIHRAFVPSVAPCPVLMRHHVFARLPGAWLRPRGGWRRVRPGPAPQPPRQAA